VKEKIDMADETTGPEEGQQAGPDALVLTPEEEAAIKASRAKADAEKQAAAEHAAAVKARKDDPDLWIGIDRGGNGVYDYIKHPDGVLAKPREEDGSKAHRRVTVKVDGRLYDHVSTDAHGIWLYR
jgi:hypothetical protein